MEGKAMVSKVISGGQTGADQLGLTVARSLGIPTGGTAPKGYLTELGPEPSLIDFGLVESDSTDYPSRTKKNVADSDGTVWFGDPTSRGGQLTLSACNKAGKPFILTPDVPTLRYWLSVHYINVLNVAGNRGSKTTAAGLVAWGATLTAALSQLTCVDGGVCHHKCMDTSQNECFRRQLCAPIGDYEGEW